MEQDSVARVERLFTTLRQLRRALAPAPGLGERELFARACELAVELGHFRFAWIGVVDEARGVVAPFVHAGEGADYLIELDISTADAPTGRGPTGTAVRERRAVVCPDIEAAELMVPWRERALAHGFRSSGAFPIDRGGRVTAVLSLYSASLGFAEPLEQAVAEAIAEELGFALDALEREAARRAAEASVRESEARYRSILDTAGDGIFVADASRRYVEANPAACALVGYSREELLTKRLDDLVAPEDLSEHPLRTEVPPGQTFTVERRLVHKDGRRIDVELHGVVLPDGTMQSVCRDVTERKRRQAEQAATERVMSLGRLAQSVGHEINNPLAYLNLSLEQIRVLYERMPEGVREDVATALASAKDGAARISHIVRALSAFGRGETDTLSAVAVPRAVTAALTLTKNRIAHVGAVDLVLGATPYVRANEFGLTQVLVNLLLNAADAMEAKPRSSADRHVVTITSKVAPDGRVAIEVADTGTGIPAVDLPRIFDPFFTTKAIGMGTGIGLSISRSIAASFGGALEAENRPEGGARFRVLLPAAEAAKATPVPARAEAPKAGRRVLVVDDEPLVARTIAMALDDHVVEIAPNVDMALAACERQDFDCILCDLMMPRGSGMDLYEQLGKAKPDQIRRMVFMTGGAFTERAARFLDAVPNARLTKPFEVDTLRQAVERAAS